MCVLLSAALNHHYIIKYTNQIYICTSILGGIHRLNKICIKILIKHPIDCLKTHVAASSVSSSICLTLYSERNNMLGYNMIIIGQNTNYYTTFLHFPFIVWLLQGSNLILPSSLLSRICIFRYFTPQMHIFITLYSMIKRQTRLR